MKHVLILFLLTIGMNALADDVTVNCTTPKNLAGDAATITGTLKKSAKPQQGYYFVSGTLKVKIGSARNVLYSDSVKVRGPELDDGSLTLGADKNPEISMIYVNTGRKDVSYVELNGKMFLSNCSK